jgi:hypothetical protein
MLAVLNIPMWAGFLIAPTGSALLARTMSDEPYAMYFNYCFHHTANWYIRQEITLLPSL